MVKKLINFNIKVIKDLSEFIVSLSTEEFAQLEKNILQEGCRDPLIVWEHGNEHILIDGHNRYRICKKHDVSFNIELKHFNNIDDVKVWMLNNQMGRRNLTPDQLSYYRGLKYLNLKKKKGGYANVIAQGDTEPSTSKLLSLEFKISESTIKRDAKFATGLNIIALSNIGLKNKILKGEVKVNKADLQILSKHTNPDSLIIKNEADLFNKAKIIRENIIDDIETQVNQINNQKLEDYRSIIKEKEPVFLEKDDRLKRLKGMIMSAINKAIDNRNVEAIEQLKQLIEKLEFELFDNNA